MYGSLDAADRWGEHYAAILVNAGFIRGRASPCHFFHPTWKVYMVVHGDDFIMASRADGRQRTLKLLTDHFEIKHDTAGPLPDMPSEIKVLGRVAACHDWGWSLETDPGLLEMAVEKLDLAEAKGVATPGVRPEGGCSGAGGAGARSLRVCAERGQPGGRALAVVRP